MAVTKQSTVLTQAHLDFQSCLRQRARVKILDSWMRGEQDRLNLRGDDLRYQGGVYTPTESQITVDAEFTDLKGRAVSAFGGLIVTSLAQMVYVDGVRRPGQKDNLKVWDTWQQNEWDSWQIALHRQTIGHGLAFATAFPARDPLTNKKMARLRAYGADKMAAFYDEPDDQWCHHAMIFEPYTVKNEPPLTSVEKGWTVKFIDETATHELSCTGNGENLDDWTYISHEVHNLRVAPVVRYANKLDLNGHATGEIEPVIPLLRRIDQDTFDRLIVQRFGAWKVRWIAGMARPKTTTSEEQQKMKLRVADLLVSPDKDTKFGTLDATDISGYLSATDADLRILAAISQTPPHHLLGLSSNLQAEALAAAEGGLLRKAGDFKTIVGESHEKLLRLAAYINGDTDEAEDWRMQVRWRDTESRSLVQTVNALGIAATALKVPVEMLWERIPGWTDQDSERAKDLVESGDTFDKVFAELEAEIAADGAKKMAEAVPPTPVKATGGSDRGAK